VKPTIQPIFHDEEMISEVPPEIGPVVTGIFGVLAHGAGCVDAPFVSVIGGLLPIALCGLTSL
jgi:hypothetical protein